MRPYVVFWQWLPWALVAAGANPVQFTTAIQRLKRIEGEPEAGGSGSGQTGYLNGNDPYQAVADYVEHVLYGKPAPFWLRSAEGK